MPSEKENPLRIDTGYGPENAPIDYAFKIAEQALAPKARSNKRLTVCAATELPAGGKRIVEDGTLSIGVFNIEGQFYALKMYARIRGHLYVLAAFIRLMRHRQFMNLNPAFTTGWCDVPGMVGSLTSFPAKACMMQPVAWRLTSARSTATATSLCCFKGNAPLHHPTRLCSCRKLVPCIFR